MKTAAIIEARMASTRLPGKTLAPILGRPMLELLIERLRRARLLDGIVVATTDRPEDGAIETLARRLNVGCYRGSSDDVLDRVLQAARRFGVDLIVEVTGDCPLIDPVIVDQIVETALATGYDYVANNLVLTYPRGLDVRAFPTATLAEVATLTADPADREHVSLHIYDHPERYRIMNLESGLPGRWHGARLTVDTAEDLEVVRTIVEALYPVNPEFGIGEILSFLDARPELLDINARVQQRPARPA